MKQIVVADRSYSGMYIKTYFTDSGKFKCHEMSQVKTEIASKN